MEFVRIAFDLSITAINCGNVWQIGRNSEAILKSVLLGLIPQNSPGWNGDRPRSDSQCQIDGDRRFFGQWRDQDPDYFDHWRIFGIVRKTVWDLLQVWDHYYQLAGAPDPN